MVFSRDNLKVLSICHIVMAIIFFGLGMADRFEVGFVFSYVAVPCWTSALIMITGILGLVVGYQRRAPSPTMSNAVWSFSAGCAVLSIVVMYVYLSTLATFVYTYGGYAFVSRRKTEAPSYTDEQSKHLAITSLVLIASVLEMLVAFGTAKSCHGQAGNYQQLQENQAIGPYPYRGEMNVALNQQPYGGMVPVIAMPVSSVNQ